MLAPEGLATDGLAADVHREHLEEGVGFVVAAAQGEEEGLEDAVVQRLGDHMLYVCGSQLARCRRVIQERREFWRDLGLDVLGRINWKVRKVLLR